MLIARLSIKGFYGVNIGFDLGPLTVITGPPGSGKSMIIELLWRVFKGVRDRVVLDDFTRIGDARIDVTITLDEWVKRKLEETGYSGDSVMLSVGIDGDSYVQAIKIGGKEVIVTEYRNGLSRVKYPMDIDVTDTSILLNPDGLIPKEQALQLVGSASEGFETVLSIIKILRDFILGLGVYRIGPYIDFRGSSRGTSEKYMDFIGEHGEDLVEILSQLFTDPRRDPDIRFFRKVLGEIGFRNFRAGWYGGELVLSYVDKRGIVHIGDELPCHMKTMLALFTQLMAARKPSVILFENADYCLSEGLGQAITKFLGNYIDGRQLIMEVRNKWFVDEIRMPHVVLYNIA